jgi:hypothetical protein
MSITFEEITGDIVPERPPQRPREGSGEADAGGLAFAERVRAVLMREKWRIDRLSDQ